MNVGLEGSRDALFRLAAECMSSSLVLMDGAGPDNPIAYVNSAFTVMTGYKPQEAIGKTLCMLQGPETDAAAIDDVRQAVASGRSIRREVLSYRKDGQTYWSDVSIDPIRSGHGRLIGAAAVMHDCSVTHIERAERLAALTRLELITSNAPGYVFQRVLKTDGTICYEYLSPSLFRILGLPEDTDWSAGQNFAWLKPDDREDFLRLTLQSATDMTTLRCDIRVLSAAGAPMWFRTNSSPRRLPNGDTVWEGLALDVTAERDVRAELDFVAQHDVLTGLPNRLFFKSAVLQSLGRDADPACKTALFHIDLHAFADINKSRGEAVADRLLRRIALTLRELAETMGGTVARMGGDEFGMLLPAMLLGESAVDVGKRICAEIRRPIFIDGTMIVIEACIGAADSAPETAGLPPGAEDRSAELMKRLGLAVNAAKRDGAGTCVLYSPAIDDGFAHLSNLRNSLRQAIEEKQFELHYQPLVDLTTGRIIGAEALVRWSHPEFGLIRPDIFIPMAESTRLIVPLGGWITRTAMRQSQLWKKSGVTVPRISINLSGVQLQSPDFLRMVEHALEETGCDAADFEFELTEGLLIEISPEVSARLSALKALGFTLALDDFGSGHATFAYLRQFPVDKIKIDQTFIRHLVVGSSDALIVRAMISMAHSLGLEVLAEGVETARQRDFLIEEGCTSGQGYLFSLPLNAEDFAWILEKRSCLPLNGTDDHEP